MKTKKHLHGLVSETFVDDDLPEIHHKAIYDRNGDGVEIIVDTESGRNYGGWMYVNGKKYKCHHITPEGLAKTLMYLFSSRR